MKHIHSEKCDICLECYKLLCDNPSTDCYEEKHKIESAKSVMETLKQSAEQKGLKLNALNKTIKNKTLPDHDFLSPIFQAEDLKHNLKRGLKTVQKISNLSPENFCDRSFLKLIKEEGKTDAEGLWNKYKELGKTLEKHFLTWLNDKYSIHVKTILESNAEKCTQDKPDQSQWKILDIIDTVDKLSVAWRNFDNVVKDYNNKLNKLEKDIEKKSEEYKTIAANSNEMEKNIEMNNEKLKMLTEEKKELKNRNKELKEKIKVQTKDLKEKEEASRKVKWQQEELDNFIKEKEAKLKSFANDLHNTLLQCSIEEGELKRIISELDIKKEELKETDKEVKSSKKTLDDLSSSIQKLKPELAELEKKKTIIQKDVGSLATELTNLKTDSSKLKDEIDKLQTQINALEEDKEKLNSEINSLKEEVKEMEIKKAKKREDATEELEDFDRKLREKKGDLEKLKINLENEQNESIKKLKSTIKDLLKGCKESSPKRTKEQNLSPISSPAEKIEENKKISSGFPSIKMIQTLRGIEMNTVVTLIDKDAENEANFCKILRRFDTPFSNVKELMITYGVPYKTTVEKEVLKGILWTNIKRSSKSTDEGIGPERTIFKNIQLDCDMSLLKKFEGDLDFEHCFVSTKVLQSAVQSIFDEKSKVKSVRIIDKYWTDDIVKIIANSTIKVELESLEIGLLKTTINANMEEHLKSLEEALKAKFKRTLID